MRRIGVLMNSSESDIFVQVTDPVAQGLVSNLTRPGGNITGFTSFKPSIAGRDGERGASATHWRAAHVNWFTRPGVA